jgi:DNA-binding response OmpR family regulator
VLVVEDERDLADLYTAWLGDRYEVRTAYEGREALSLIDEDVDVALIDRLMPNVSGDEVLASVQEAGYDCRVAMVTAVEPDFDIIEMGFDAYVVKPALRTDITGTVERLLRRGTYDRQVREMYALASKRALLRTQKSERELARSESFQRLGGRLEALYRRLDETAADLDGRDFEMTLRRLAADGTR